MKPRKILAVDDSKLMLRMYEVMLRPGSLVFAEDGLAALACIERDPDIDLVILDVNMPGMDGISLLGELRQRGLLQRVRVVMVTTEGSEAQVARGLAAGASGYLTKPVDRERLLEAMSALPTGGV